MHPAPEPAVPGYGELSSIGRGGLGDVYRARRQSDGSTVAIKVLRDIGDGSQARHRIRRELTALLALGGHPNVVRPIELIDLPQGPALVMEYAPGGSVAGLVMRSGATLSLDECVFVGRQTAAALSAAHAGGIVHRDVKPQNLLIDAAGQIKLCDFGIAALLAHDDYCTRTNAMSMRYASPEELELHADVGTPSDVYSLGATLLYLWRRESLTLKDRLVTWRPPVATDQRSAAFDRLIATCLQPDPGDRPGAGELVEALGRLALGGGTRLVTTLDRGSRPQRSLQSHQTSVIDVPALSDDDLPRVLERAVPNDDQLTIEPDPSDIDHRPPELVSLDRLRQRPGRLRRRRATSVVSIVLVLVIVLVTVVAALIVAPTIGSWRRGDGGDPSTTVAETALDASATTITTTIPASRPATVARPAGLPPLVDADWRSAVRDCLTQVAGQARLDVVECEQPHDVQKYAEGVLPGDGDFDAVAVAAAVARACDDALAGFVGTTPETTTLDIAVTRPSAASWAAGDRNYACYVGIEGARLLGDARTSGW